MSEIDLTPDTVLDYWFGLPDEAYFKQSDALDAELRERFSDVLAHARAGALDSWAETFDGKLALVIVLDQMSRNIHRGSAEMYAGDAKALAIARAALEDENCKALPKMQVCWLVLPFMHSENLGDQQRCVELCTSLGLDGNLKYAIHHKDIVEQFGRFPHRNELLGRASTAAEEAFLAEGGFQG